MGGDDTGGLRVSLGLTSAPPHRRRRSPSPAMAGPPGLKPLVAVGQVTSTPDKELNFAACAGLVREAAGRGAAIVFLPEGFDYIGRDAAQTLRLAEGLDGDLMGRYADLARYPRASGGDGDSCPQTSRGDAVSLSPGTAACGCPWVASTSVARTGPPPNASTTATRCWTPQVRHPPWPQPTDWGSPAPVSVPTSPPPVPRSPGGRLQENPPV